MVLRTGFLIAAVGLAGSLSACKPMPSGSYAPGYEDDYYGDGGDYEADAEYDESVQLTSIEGRSRGRRWKASRADMAPAASGGLADAPPPPQPEPGPAVTPTEPEPEPTDDPPDTERHIIYTATMQVSVFNLEDARARAESLPELHGGFVQNLSANQIIMRIPAAKLRSVMDELGTLGVVDSRTLDAQDVTEEYLDIETRIAVLQSTQKQLTALLAKATTVKEALEVRKALDSITMELEVLKGRLRRLGNLVAFSTLTLTLYERGPHTATPNSNDPFPWVDSLGVEGTEWK